MKHQPMRMLTIVAQDPGVRVDDKILTTRVPIPNESVGPGPSGYRAKVIDYDCSSKTLYTPLKGRYEGGNDPFENPTNTTILKNPHFHAQNVYAIVMWTLARFERALGRRVPWSFNGHQITLAPHAFADANAFYSKRDRGLMFGYFPAAEGNQMVFSCLSHDVVVHEATHALLDGLRERFTDPSSADQAAIHEGIADVVALLSVFSLRDVVKVALLKGGGQRPQARPKLINVDKLNLQALKDSLLMGLAEQMGDEISAVRGQALRRSAKLPPTPNHLSSEEYTEPHRRGEILVAAMMNAFLRVWLNRLAPLRGKEVQHLDLERVVEEAADSADHLLTMAIRAIDYTPTTDIEFSDYLSSLLTADSEMHADDSKYGYRGALRRAFDDYGITPAATGTVMEPGIWEPPPHPGKILYDRMHPELMRRDCDEVFRFIWHNRGPERLGLCEDAYTLVLTVVPCHRVSVDGFTLRESVAQYMQQITLEAGELHRYDITKPVDMSDSQKVTLYGGGSLVFDQHGRLKFHVRNQILNKDKQIRRLAFLWGYDRFASTSARPQPKNFADMHRRRFLSQQHEHVGV